MGEEKIMADLSSITEPKKQLVDTFKKINLAWCFDKWHEKFLLVVLSSLGILRIIQWII